MLHHLPRLPHISNEPVSISWNGSSVTGCVGDSIAATLYGSGIRAFTKSRKFHEWRGLSGSFAAGHLATVDGLPHCRLERMIVEHSQCVEMENVWPSAGFDIMTASKLLPRRMIRAGFEHPRIIPDGSLAWKAWEKLLWNMAGEASPPIPEKQVENPAVRLSADTLVVGGGPCGMEASRQAEGSVVLVSRSRELGGLAFGTDAGDPDLPENVTVLTDHEAYALFDNARIAMAAPNNPNEPAVLIEANKIVLATGLNSVPPLVPGAAIPGVIDARTALHLAARYGVQPGEHVLVVGTARGRSVANRLSSMGCNVVDFVDVTGIERIVGGRTVTAVVVNGRRIKCDSVVHAGPWRADPSLVFQAGADGDLRLLAGDLPSNVSTTGACTEAIDDITFGRTLDRRALVCPCMDVTVDEVIGLINRGITHVEELKRRSTCGMGTCQGVPCWDYLATVVADVTGKSVEEVGHPSYRPPRAAITFGQAAGLASITEVEP